MEHTNGSDSTPGETPGKLTKRDKLGLVSAFILIIIILFGYLTNPKYVHDLALALSLTVVPIIFTIIAGEVIRPSGTKTRLQK